MERTWRMLLLTCVVAGKFHIMMIPGIKSGLLCHFDGTFHGQCSSSSWRSIASDEDVSESYGVSAAQSWTRKCDHTGGMQQQPLGQVFFLCGHGAYDRDPANVSF